MNNAAYAIDLAELNEELLPSIHTTIDKDDVEINALLKKLNDSVLVICRQGFVLAHLSANSEQDLSVQVQQYSLQLKQYIKTVSVDLYMTLRSAPLDVKTRRKLTSFESETKQDVKLIADLLQSGKTGSAKTVEFADSVFYRITKLMMKRHNEERDFLHPLFLQVNRTA